MIKMIVVNEQRCLECKTCVLECALAHTGAHSLLEALNAETPPQPRVHVEPLGEFGMPMQCRHCEDAPCMIICPKGAIHRPTPESPVLIDADKCNGCKFCTLVCPFGIISVLRNGNAVIKCDLCIERTEAGREPACVAGCPTGALQFVELDDNLRRRRRQESERVAEIGAQYTAPPDNEQKMVSCEICGRAFAPRKQLEFVRSKMPDNVPVPNVCPPCRRSQAARMLSEVSGALEGTDAGEADSVSSAGKPSA